jgi:Cu(I)/Ag(I) efflux system protein CusF
MDDLVRAFSKAGGFEFARFEPIAPKRNDRHHPGQSGSNPPKGNTMNGIKLAAAILALSLLDSPAVFAQDAMVKGEVKKVDEAAKKITLKHGAIKSLGMEEDGMTMVFKVQDPAMLKQVKAGDKVQFTAERGSDGIAITKIQKSK